MVGLLVDSDDIDVFEDFNAPDIPGPPCLHCNALAVMTTGKEVYPHRKDLWAKTIWICRACTAYCGCHPDTFNPLGFPANKETRMARMKLHNLRLDPIWKNATLKKRKVRGQCYRIMAAALGIEGKDCHTGMFSLEQCREAWRSLEGVTSQNVGVKAHNSERNAQ